MRPVQRGGLLPNNGWFRDHSVPRGKVLRAGGHCVYAVLGRDVPGHDPAILLQSLPRRLLLRDDRAQGPHEHLRRGELRRCRIVESHRLLRGGLQRQLGRQRVRSLRQRNVPAGDGSHRLRELRPGPQLPREGRRGPRETLPALHLRGWGQRQLHALSDGGVLGGGVHLGRRLLLPVAGAHAGPHAGPHDRSHYRTLPVSFAAPDASAHLRADAAAVPTAVAATDPRSDAPADAATLT